MDTTTTFEQIIGKKSLPVTARDIRAKAAAYTSVAIDLGCGDGMLPYRLALKDPQTFYIGIDAARESLADASAKAVRKPARGGCENVLFLCMNLLNIPAGLERVAGKLLFNFPWGSLMYAQVNPDLAALRAMAALGKDGAAFELYLNLYVFQNDTQREDMGLPEVDGAYVEHTLIPGWAAAGLVTESWRFAPSAELKDHPSSWAGRLVRRSGRDTLIMRGTVKHKG